MFRLAYVLCATLGEYVIQNIHAKRKNKCSRLAGWLVGSVVGWPAGINTGDYERRNGESIDAITHDGMIMLHFCFFLFSSDLIVLR